MGILSLLTNVAGATMLLLFAVRTVQIGVEACAGPTFRRFLAGRKKNRLKSSIMGMFMAVVLQSSAAATLLTVGFVSTGAIGFSSALATVLGADLGSALVVQLLSFQIDWLAPLLLAIGGWLYVKSQSGDKRHIGQIVLGIGLILIALRLLSDAFEPMRDSAVLPAVVSYLENDFVSAFLTGAALALIMHSSVAVIISCVTIAALGIIPVGLGLSVIFGANLGSSLIPVWLTRGQPAAARRIPVSNFGLRGAMSIAALLVFNRFEVAVWFPTIAPGQMLIYAHVLFNALLLLTLPFLGMLETPAKVLLPDKFSHSAQRDWTEISCLDAAALSSPTLALANMKREVLRMSQILTAMVKPALGFYRVGDVEQIKQMRDMDLLLNQALSGVRQYGADLPYDRMNKQDQRLARDLTDVAVDLEAAGDIISKQLLHFATQVQAKRIRFSSEGWGELTKLNDKVIENMALAFGVLATNNLGMAQQVVEEKSAVRRLERNSRKHHFERLREGGEQSFDSSDMHLETLRALKELNSKIASISYPVLRRNEQLVESNRMPKE